MSYDPTQYSRLLQPYRRALVRLRLDLDFFLEESGPIIVVSVDHRTKSFERAAEKAQRLGINLSELDDLAGFRVVCGTQLDAKLLGHFFRNGLRGTSFNVLKDSTITRKDGYRGRHLVIEVPENHTGTWQPCRIEIQIHTALQNAFNRLSRAWLYSSRRALSEDLQSRFQAFAKKLSELDEVASNLQTELFSAAEGTRDDDSLTPLGYQVVLREVFQEESDEENAIWHTLYYRRCGIETCGELRGFFGRSDMLQLYDEWRASCAGDDPSLALAESKGMFWQACGTRMEWAKEFLKSRSASPPHMEDGSG